MNFLCLYTPQLHSEDSQKPSLISVQNKISMDEMKHNIEKLKRYLEVQYKKNLLMFQTLKENPQIQYQHIEAIETNTTINDHGQQIVQDRINAISSIKFHLISKVQKHSQYQIFIECQINLEKSSILFNSFLMHNYSIVSVQSQNSAIVININLLNRNSLIKEGSFHINFVCNYLITNDKILYLLKNPVKFQQTLFDIKLKFIQTTWSIYLKEFYRYFNINSKIIQTLNNQSVKMKNHRQKVNLLTNHIRRSHVDSSILSNYVRFSKEVSEHNKYQRVEKLMQKQKLLEKEIKCLLNQFQQILHIFEGKSLIEHELLEPQKQITHISKEQKKVLEIDLNCSKLVSKTNIYSQIQIIQIKNVQPLQQTTFSKIEWMEVLARKNAQQFPMPTFLVRKYSKQDRYNNEVQILKLIQNQAPLFLPRYHFCQKQPFQESIFMEYIPDGTISSYFSYRNFCISPMTKIFLLYQATIALRFLRDFGIVHKDIKPGNILVKLCGNKNVVQYLVKLIDFGQSYCHRIRTNTKNLGHTIPYASPQDLISGRSSLLIKLDQKSDVFSFGIMLFELIFNTFPPQLARIGKKAYKDDDYLKFYSVPFEKLQTYGGMKDLSRLLHYLCLKCLNPDPNDRPTLDWLCIVMKNIIIAYQQ